MELWEDGHWNLPGLMYGGHWNLSLDGEDGMDGRVCDGIADADGRIHHSSIYGTTTDVSMVMDGNYGDVGSLWRHSKETRTPDNNRKCIVP